MSALIIWNAVGIGLLLYIALGDTSDAATTRVVFNVVFWPMLAGDLVLAVIGLLGARMRKRQLS